MAILLLAEPSALGPQPARAEVWPVPLAPTILKSNSLVPASQQVKAGGTDTPDITIEPESLENEHFHRPPLIAFKDSSENSNLLRIREERGNQEAHPEKEVFAEKMPLFGEPYKTTKRDELSRQIQNVLGDYEVMKELWRSMSCTQCPNGSLDSQGKPK